jgi:NADH-quinone oxidoreductase subunit G
MDAVGTNIRIDARGRQVLRVLPRVNDDVNEEWAHDKTRHHIDGLMARRLDRPWVRRNGKLVPASWSEAFAVIADRYAASKLKLEPKAAVIAGDLVDCETLFAAKMLAAAMGSDLLEGRQTGLDYDTSHLAAVNFNSGIAAVEEADVVLLIGTNLRWEAPLINTRLRKAVYKRGAKVFAIGQQVDLTYNAEWLGDDAALIAKLPKVVVDAFAKAERPMVIVGGGALAVPGAQGAAQALVGKLGLIKDGWNGFNVVHMAASRMGGLMLGYAQNGGIASVSTKQPRIAFFLGADEVDFSAFAKTLKVYVGHHGDKGAAAADVILPSAAWPEKPGTYVNTEGRVQRSERATFPPGDAREDWSIIRALADALGVSVGFDSFEQCRSAMIAAVPALGEDGVRADYGWGVAKLDAKPAGPIPSPIKDFYLTNAIARASETMQRCSAELVRGENFAEAAE